MALAALTVLCWLMWLARGLPPGSSASAAVGVASSSIEQIHPERVQSPIQLRQQPASTATANRHVPSFFVSPLPSYHQGGEVSSRNGVHSSQMRTAVLQHQQQPPQQQQQLAQQHQGQDPQQPYPYREVTPATSGESGDSRRTPAGIGSRTLFQRDEDRDDDDLVAGRSDTGPDQVMSNNNSDGYNNDSDNSRLLHKTQSAEKGIERQAEEGEAEDEDAEELRAHHDAPVEYLPIQRSRLANCSGFLEVIRGKQFPLRIVRSSRPRVTLSHPFIDIQLGILPGGTYTVNLPSLPIERSSTPHEEARYIFVEGESARDDFSHLPAKVTSQCGGQGGVVMVLHGGERPHNENPSQGGPQNRGLTLHWKPDIETPSESDGARGTKTPDMVTLTVVYSLNWNTLAVEEVSVQVRSGCHRLLETAFVEVSDLNLFNACAGNDVQLILQAPRGHQLFVQFTSVTVRGNAKISARTEAEKGPAGARVVAVPQRIPWDYQERHHTQPLRPLNNNLRPLPGRRRVTSPSAIGDRGLVLGVVAGNSTKARQSSPLTPSGGVLSSDDGRWVALEFHVCRPLDAQGGGTSVTVGCQFAFTAYALKTNGCNASFSESASWTSPFFPERYPPGLNCRLKINAPQGQRVVLTVHRLSLGAGCGDLLRIGPLAGSQVNKTLCGPPAETTEEDAGKEIPEMMLDAPVQESQGTPDTMVSLAGELIIDFLSDLDNNDGGAGVSLSWEVVPVCANRSLTAASGEMCFNSSTELRLAISVDIDCVFTVYAPLGFKVHVELSALSVVDLSKPDRRNNASLNCGRDFIEVDSDTGRTRLCGEWTSEVLGTSSLGAFDSSESVWRLRIHGRASPLRRLAFCARFERRVSDIKYLRCDPSAGKSTNDTELFWLSRGNFCYRVFSRQLSWWGANDHCLREGGFLAVIDSREVQSMLDKMLHASPVYPALRSFWIGASDIRYESCYEWPDGTAVQYTNWFPGWANFSNYNKQPNDDADSDQNCVQVQDTFVFPSKGRGVTESFYWNDRHCQAQNPFICQKPRAGAGSPNAAKSGGLVDLDVNCNRSVILSGSQPSEVLHSPLFPAVYPPSRRCHFSVQLLHGTAQQQLAHSNVSIELRFLEFDLEDHESCDYDYVEVTGEARHSPSGLLNSSGGRICGNWNERIKLLRFTASRSMQITFVSDFSHAFKGFKAEVLIVNDDDEDLGGHPERRCESADYRFHGGHCYLVGGMPQVSWSTAVAICRESNATLLMIEPDDDATVHQSVQLLAELLEQQTWKSYSHRSPLWFWVNARKTELDASAQQSDDVTLDNIHADAEHRKCGAIPWKSPAAAGGVWLWRRCTLTGGYVCQKNPVVVPSSLNSTLTSPSGVAGFLRTPAPDAPYLDNLHYTKNIVAEPGQRIFVFFESIDVEWQVQCLYDYVELTLSPSGSAGTISGSGATSGGLIDRASTGSPGVGSTGGVASSLRICGQMENGQRPTIVYNGTARVMQRNESLQFISSGTELQVTVHTDHSTLGSGFSLRWEVLNIVTECGSAELPVVLLVEEGTARNFMSIRYPERYPPSVRCHYQIQPGVRGPVSRGRQQAQRISGRANNKRDGGPDSPTTVLLTFAAFQVGTRNDTTNSCLDDYLELNLGDGDRTLKLCGYLPEGHQVMAYQTSVWINFVSVKGGFRGFSIKYQLFSAQQLSTVLSVGEGGSELRPLNYPQPVPAHLSQLSVKIFSGAGHRIEFITRNYTGRHMGNLKKIIFEDPFAQYRKTQKAFSAQDYNRTRRAVATSSAIPTSQWQCVVYIPSDGNASSGRWSNPESNMDSTSTELVTIKSLLNGMVINYEPQDNLLIRYKVEKDENFTSVAVKELDVPESSFALPTCRPNPCFNGGRCLEESGRNVCKCLHAFNGVLCHLSPCDSGFCKRGKCRMNENTRMPECLCEAGYIGERCGQRRSPCEHNPCGPHGMCKVVTRTGNRLDYDCVCPYAYDGRHCEHHHKLILMPLSERMVKEPFWLGLITVGTVLLIILMVYCVKRKFADKIEKFLADEIERSKNNPPSPPAARYSVGSARPSLTPVSTSAVPANTQSLSPQPTQRDRTSSSSLLNRIRRQSIRSGSPTLQCPSGNALGRAKAGGAGGAGSASSQQLSVASASASAAAHNGSGSNSRQQSSTPIEEAGSSNPFSFEDIVKRATSSGLASKKHSLNSTSDSDCNTNSAQRKPSLLHQPSFSERSKPEKNPETAKILASLVAPSQDTKRRMSLDEFIRLSERKLQHARRSTEDTTPGDVSDVSIASEASSMETSFMQAHHQMRPHSSIREHSFERSNSSVEDPEGSGVSLLARQPSTTTALHLRTDNSRDGDGFTSASENEQAHKANNASSNNPGRPPMRQYRLYNTRQNSQRETPTLVLSSRCGTPRGSFDAHYSSTERDSTDQTTATSVTTSGGQGQSSGQTGSTLAHALAQASGVTPGANAPGSPQKGASVGGSSHPAALQQQQQQQTTTDGHNVNHNNNNNNTAEQMSHKEAKGAAFMELLHKTIAQLPQSHDVGIGGGAPLQTHPDRPASPGLAKIAAHTNTPAAAATTTQLSPSYENKMFEPPTTQAPQPKLKSHPAEVLPLRKFSVELPMPKILITANVSSCESEAESPPRSPALATGVPGGYPMERCQLSAANAGACGGSTVKMCYLSPFMGTPGAADSRTISESNLSTSGYSSISSPGLSRCNSSSPMIADETAVGAFQRVGQGHLQASPTRAARKASHQLVATFSSNYPPPTSSSASSASTSAREQQQQQQQQQHHMRQQHNSNSSGRDRDEGMCTTPLVPTARPGGPFGQYLLEPDGQESTRRRSSFGGCFASHEGGPGGNSRHHDSAMAGHCGIGGLPPSHPGSRCPSRLSERALLFRATRNSQQTTSNEESFDEEIKRELEGRYNQPSPGQDVCGHATRGHWIPSYARTASSLDIPSEEPAMGRSRAPSSWSVPDSMRHDHDTTTHSAATSNICNHIRAAFQLDEPRSSFSHHGPDQEREIREVLLQRARCKSWQPLPGGQTGGTGGSEQNFSPSGSGSVSRSPSHLEPTTLSTLGQELTGGLSSPSSTASMESVVPSKICRNASKASMGATSASGLPGNVTTSESDSERKHAAQVQAQRAARRLQKKQRSVDAGGGVAAAAGGGGSTAQLHVDRQKLSPGLRPQRSRSPCLSPWSSVDRPGYSPRGSTQDLGGKMFICSSSSSDEEPTIDYAMNYVEAANRQSRGTGSARLMRSATVETCDCSHKPRRQRSRCSQESQSPHSQTPSSSSRNLLAQPSTPSYQKSASFDGGCDYAAPGSEGSPHGSPSRSPAMGTFRGLSRDASSNSGSWGSHHSLRRQCALQDNTADEMDVFGDIPDPDFYPRATVTETHPPPEIRAEHPHEVGLVGGAYAGGGSGGHGGVLDCSGPISSRRTTSAKVATLGKIVAGGTYSNSESSVSSVDKTDLSSGKEIDVPKIEIQMPTPLCESKGFEQQQHQHQQQHEFQQQLQPRTVAGGGPGGEDELPTIMVQSATPVATPVLEHKVFHIVQPTTLEAEQPEEMQSVSRSGSLSQGSHGGQSSHRHSHSSSRWERDLRKFRSESLGSSSRATQRPKSLTSTRSFEAYDSSFPSPDNTSQMSSIFEPETEAGLYDDDNESGASDSMGNVSIKPYSVTARRQQAPSSHTNKGSSLRTVVPQLRVESELYEQGSDELYGVAPAAGTGFGAVEPKSTGGAGAAGSRVICIELEPPTPTTDEDPQIERGVISFPSPPEPSTPINPESSSVACQQQHALVTTSASPGGHHRQQTQQQSHHWDSDNSTAGAVTPSPSDFTYASECHQCTQHNTSSPPLQLHDDQATTTTTTTTMMRTIMGPPGTRESPAGVVDSSSANSDPTSITVEGNNPQHKT